MVNALGLSPFQTRSSPFEQAFEDEKVLEAMAQAQQENMPPFGPAPVPQQPQPVYRPPQQPQSSGLPGQEGLKAFFGSPGAMMASVALDNISAGQPNGVQMPNPVAAYQQGVVRQAALRQQEQATKLREAQEARLRAQEARVSNPFYEYEMFREKYPEQAKDMTFAEFSQIGLRPGDRTSSQKDLATFMALNPDATPEDINNFFSERVRAGSNYDMGGGGVARYNPITGRMSTLVTPDVATGREGLLAGTKESSTQQAKTKEEQVRLGLTGAQGARVAYNQAQNVLDITKDYLNKVESGELQDTGVVASMMMNMFGIGSEELGSLNSDSIRTGLANLGITNLAPVTEQEFAQVLNLWANISKSPEVNKGALKSAVSRTERLIDTIKDDAIYNWGLIEQYGTESQQRAFLRANPFVAELIREQETGSTPEDDPDIDI